MFLGVGLYGFRLWVMGIRSWVIWVSSYGFLLSVKLMQRYSFCFNKAIFLEIIHKKRPRGRPLCRAVRGVTFSFLHMVFAKGDLSPAERSPFIVSTVTLCMAKGDLWLFRRLVVCWFCAIFCFIQYVDLVAEYILEFGYPLNMLNFLSWQDYVVRKPFL